MPSHAASPPFVGRADEVRALQERLSAALAGHGGILLLAGEPGIGKTRLAEELAARATATGAAAVWGRCYEAEGAPAYWPWVEVLRTVLRDLTPAAVPPELAAALAFLAQSMPELGTSLPGAAASTLSPSGMIESRAADGAQTRFRQFDAVAALLNHAAATRPLVILLDDLHWADVPSLLLLEFVARQTGAAPLLIAATYRDTEVTPDHPLARTLGQLARLPRALRLSLRGLPEPDITRLITDLTGTDTAAGLSAAVGRISEGNPFYITEIVRHLGRESGLPLALPPDGAPLPIPPSIQDVMQLRLARLDGDCRRLLELAAVIGREFSLRALTQIGEALPSDLLALLEQAEAARLIEQGDALGSYRFTHTLVRATLYDGMLHTRRVRLHLQAGLALERLWGDAPEHLPELAWHFTRAAPAGDPERAITYARKAGDRAVTLLAYEEGVRFFQMALAALDHSLPEPAARRADLLLALGEAHTLAGDTTAGQSAYWRAVEEARALRGRDDDSLVATLLARAGLGISRLTLSVHPPEPRLAALLDEALAALGPTDSLLRVQLLGQIASDLALTDNVARREQLSEEAVAVARRVGDPRALAVALLAQHNALRGPDGHERQLATATEALDLAEAAGDSTLALLARRLRVVDLTEMGDFAAFTRDRQAHERLAQRLKDPYHLWLAALWRAMQAQMDGRMEAALDLAGQALALGRRGETSLAQLYHALQVAAVHLEWGPVEDGIAAYRAIPADYPALDGMGAILAGLYLAAGQPDRARGVYEHTLPATPRRPAPGQSLPAPDLLGFRKSGHWLLIMAHFARVAAALQDRESAATLYTLLTPYAGRVAMASPAAVCYGSVAYYLGLLAATLAPADTTPDVPESTRPTVDDAAHHFEHALAVNERIGARVWLARTRLAYADLLISHATSHPDRDQHSADLRRASDLLDESARAAGEMGLERLAAEVAHRRDAQTPAAGRAVPSAPPTPDATAPQPAPQPLSALPATLTPRELDVLRLLAAGHTNQQIADALVLSLATVRGHTISIYGKIGASGRAAAAAFALRHGIIPPDHSA